MIAKNKWWFGSYLFFLISFAIWSYSLVHPSLVLTNFAPYCNFQQWMWQTFYSQRLLLVIAYLVIFIGLWVSFYYWQKSLPKKISRRSLLLLLAIICLPLLISHNALSADIFNYLFNAKMVVVYQQNPHLVSPWTVSDEWLRFMHNINSPAPYGYLWTGISIPLYLLGGGKFTLTWLIFKLFNYGGWLSTAWIFYPWIKNKKWWVILFFNPLLLIEIIANGHNDLWMMLPAVASLLLIKNKQNFKTIAGSLLLLIVSIAMKKVTIILVPFWLFLIFAHRIDWHSWRKTVVTFFQKYFFDFISLAMFAPLFTDRSWQFYPWYLLWSFIWLPWLQAKTWRNVLLIFSVTGLLRYIPYFLTLEYNQFTLNWQKIILWTPAIIYLIIVAGRWLIRKIRVKNH